MPNTYYETDRLFALLFVLVINVLFWTVMHIYEKRHNITNRNRAEYYAKKRNERR